MPGNPVPDLNVERIIRKDGSNNMVLCKCRSLNKSKCLICKFL